MIGIEPTTYGLQNRCSANWATPAWSGQKNASKSDENNHQISQHPYFKNTASSKGVNPWTTNNLHLVEVETSDDFVCFFRIINRLLKRGRVVKQKHDELVAGINDGTVA